MNEKQLITLLGDQLCKTVDVIQKFVYSKDGVCVECHKEMDRGKVCEDCFDKIIQSIKDKGR